MGGSFGIPLVHSPRMTLRGAALLLLLALQAACSRPAPSPDYLAAREKHAALLAAHPMDAAGRAEMDEVLRLLGQVPEQSADAPAARELRERIVKEREALAAAAVQRAELAARAGEAPAWPSATSIGRPPPPPPPVAPGMALEEFRNLHGACFDRQPGEFRLTGADGKDQPVESWVVSGDPECRERYASLADRLVLVADAGVVAVRPAADAKQVTEERVVRSERAVELVPLPGGWGVRGADGKVERLPPGAEVRMADGKPLPPPPPAAPSPPGAEPRQ